MTNYASSKDHYRPKILVVDDEQRIRDACQMVLTEEGFQVEQAADGRHGLKMIEQEHFDIILLDLMMPNISGFDVLSKVRDIHPDTVVIVITGYATIEHSIEAMKKGAFDFIPKPFTPDQLRVVVSKGIQYTNALQDIADARSRLKVMVNRLSDGVMMTDSLKRVVLANPAFLHNIEYHGESVIGHAVEEFITAGHLPGLIDQALAMPLDEFTEITEEMPQNKEDDPILSVRCSPFRDRMGQNIGTITVLHDITALKKMDRMKSDFVSMVSHEIRSPMNSLLAQLKIMSDGLAGEVTEKQQEILGRASEKIKNLSNMASELLDLSRIESGLITQEKEELKISDILTEQADFHKAGAQDKNISIYLESVSDLPRVMGNRQNMEEVMSNLITNAIKYSPQGAIITISARVEDQYLGIHVKDTGLGISKEDMVKLFTRFYRVKNEKTRYIQGTGLGLAIVESIIKAHQGRVCVKSKPGQGSTFSVYLPVPGS